MGNIIDDIPRAHRIRASLDPEHIADKWDAVDGSVETMRAELAKRPSTGPGRGAPNSGAANVLAANARGHKVWEVAAKCTARIGPEQRRCRAPAIRGSAKQRCQHHGGKLDAQGHHKLGRWLREYDEAKRSANVRVRYKFIPKEDRAEARRVLLPRAPLRLAVMLGEAHRAMRESGDRRPWTDALRTAKQEDWLA